MRFGGIFNGWKSEVAPLAEGKREKAPPLSLWHGSTQDRTDRSGDKGRTAGPLKTRISEHFLGLTPTNEKYKRGGR